MLLEQFRHFYRHTFPEEMEKLIELYALFGGTELEIDATLPVKTLVTEQILEHYGEHFNTIDTLLLGDPQLKRLLHAAARGDRRTHSVYRHARLGESQGDALVEQLRILGILQLEYSREAPPRRDHPKQRFKKEIERHRISHKLLFTSPFWRFWFYFIYPRRKEIERGVFDTVLSDIEKRQSAFTGLVFEELCQLYLQNELQSERRCGSYWDRQVELDLLATDGKGGYIVGECKWTNTKVNRAELGKLQEKCAMIGLEPSMIYLFSKRGFSNELLQSNDSKVELVAASDLSRLLKS